MKLSLVVGKEMQQAEKFPTNARLVTFTQWDTGTLSGWHGCDMTAHTKETAFPPQLMLIRQATRDGCADRGSWMGQPLPPGELSNRRGLCLKCHIKQGCAPTDQRTVSDA